MTDPYIQINGTKIEVFDNDLSAVKSIKQLDEDTPVTDTKCRVWLGTQQYDLTDATPTKILLDTESYDIGGNFASYKFVAPVTGYYLIIGLIQYTQAIADKRYTAQVYKNNAPIASSYTTNGNSTGDVSVSVTDIAYLTATDYIELFGAVIAGANTIDVQAGIAWTYLSIHLLSL